MLSDPFTQPLAKGQSPYWLREATAEESSLHERLCRKLESLHNAAGRFVPPKGSRLRSWHQLVKPQETPK